MRIVSIVGNRPQFIKASTFLGELAKRAGVRSELIHTGQHYDANMSDVFFSELGIPKPDVHLGVGSGSHGAQTGQMLVEIEPLLMERKPNWVVVFGDTNTTLAGALAAAKLHIPVAHIEAGLRSFNKKMPEEINRIVTDHVSDVLFAPTPVARKNLVREGVAEGKICETGDIMYDVALAFRPRAQASSRILERLGVAPKQFILSTVHRAENTDDPMRLEAILEALLRLAKDLPVVLPLHPRTRSKLPPSRLKAVEAGLKLVEPLGYLDMTRLEETARLIATDSGGVQKEAYFHGVPTVVLRPETEWVELVESGWTDLCNPTSGAVVEKALRARLARGPGFGAGIYGDGRASIRIVDRLMAGAAR